MSPSNYDAWFDYLRLMESEADDIDIVRDVYERAIGNIPPIEVNCQVLKCFSFNPISIGYSV